MVNRETIVKTGGTLGIEVREIGEVTREEVSTTRETDGEGGELANLPTRDGTGTRTSLGTSSGTSSRTRTCL